MPIHSTDIRNVDRFELAAILARLRLLQASPALPAGIEEVATDAGDFERLDDAQIDTPCETLNTAATCLGRDMTDERIHRDADEDADDAALDAHVASLFEEIGR